MGWKKPKFEAPKAKPKSEAEKRKEAQKLIEAAEKKGVKPMLFEA